MIAGLATRTRFLSSGRPVFLATVGLVLLACACERQEQSNAPADPDQSRLVVEPPPAAPKLTFPAEIRAAHPEISVFLDRFLNVWLTSDYPGYRRLVSRAHTPEGRERFEMISRATAAITVEIVELLEESRLPSPAYRAVFLVELTPEAAERRGELTRGIAIIIFKELEQWKMAAAPDEFQPAADQPASAPAETPATAPAPAIEYPWDEEGDY